MSVMQHGPVSSRVKFPTLLVCLRIERSCRIRDRGGTSGMLLAMRRGANSHQLASSPGCSLWFCIRDRHHRRDRIRIISSCGEGRVQVLNTVLPICGGERKTFEFTNQDRNRSHWVEFHFPQMVDRCFESPLIGQIEKMSDNRKSRVDCPFAAQHGLRTTPTDSNRVTSEILSAAHLAESSARLWIWQDMDSLGQWAFILDQVSRRSSIL